MLGDDNDSYYNRGLAYFEINKISRALNDFEKVLSLDKNNFNAHGMLGDIYGDLNKLSKSLEHYGQLIRMPRHMYERLNNRQSALIDYEKAYRVSRDNIEIVNELVWAYSTYSGESLKNKATALMLAKKWLVTSKDPQYLDTAAAAFATNNDYSGAILLANKAIKLINK